MKVPSMKTTWKHARRAIVAICLFATPTFGDGETTQPPAPSALKPIERIVPFAVRPLSPRVVKLTGGPLKRAQDLDVEYLLKLEPDRMLAYLRKRAGLPAKAAGYGGWDGNGRQLTGHIAGHYLSAVSYMYEATGDERFKQRADYTVAQLKEIQDKQGDGYIGGLMGFDPHPATMPAAGATQPTTHRGRRPEPPLLDGKILFRQLAKGQIRSGGFDLNGMWSPWYVQHKLYAGLRDAYRLTGNRTALEVEIKFAAWAKSVIGDLNAEQAQKMLATEFGGMNEVLVDLYADTGDKQWLTLADQFDHRAIVDPLAKGEDILAGKHGNTQVPKLLGNLVRYLYTGSKTDGDAATFFWDAVVDHHSFATGGHGYDEYFGPADKLNGQIDGTGQRSKSLRTAETCNVYNMLKMTRLLFALHPDVRYADFHERALYNHILASIDPENGRTCYMVPVGPGVIHEYQEMFDSFTCCVGTGMESHALHADGLYYEGDRQLFVNVYAPTTVAWANAKAMLTMETDLPLGEVATLKVTSIDRPQERMVSFRRPRWAADGFRIAVNGQPVAEVGKPGSFVSISRTWAAGDVVTITLPKLLHTESLPDNPDRVALMWGPLVLAGDFGPQNSDDQSENARSLRSKFPVFPHADRPLIEWLKPVADKPGRYSAALADGAIITLSPFFALHNRRYSLYWDLFTPQQWAERQNQYTEQESKQQALANATVAYFQPGEMQPERDFSFQSDAASQPLRIDGQPGRVGGAWFSFETPIDPNEPVAVVLTMRLNRDAKPALKLSVNDAAIEGEPTAVRNVESDLTEVTFRLPRDLTREKKRATLRCDAPPGQQLLPILGIRVVRIDDVLK
jgi:uncharacterized protein